MSKLADSLVSAREHDAFSILTATKHTIWQRHCKRPPFEPTCSFRVVFPRVGMMDENVLELEDDAPELISTGHVDAEAPPDTPPSRVPITIITGMSRLWGTNEVLTMVQDTWGQGRLHC